MSGSLPGFHVRLVRTPSYRANVGLRRIWSHRAFGRRLYAEAVYAVESGQLLKPDLIVASLPPMEGPAVALQLRERFGCRVVTDIMDGWPETFLQAFPSRAFWRTAGRFLLRPYMRMLERACVQSDAVSAQSEAFAAYARAHGASGDIHVCHLGAEAADFSRVRRDPSTPVRFLYLGAMGRSYDLETLFEAVERVQCEQLHFEMVMVGDGEKRKSLESKGLGSVRFTGHLTGRALNCELLQADIGIVPIFRESGVAVPYKAGDYLAYGMPILSSLDGELGEMIRVHKCGAIYEPRNCNELVGAIRTYASDQRRIDIESANALKCFNEHFNRALTYPRFADWLEKFASSAGLRTGISH